VSDENPNAPSESPVMRLRRANATRKAAGLPIGRPKGSPNKVTAAVREGLLYVYNDLGGHEGFATWARKHRAAFYHLMFKVIPKEREANALGTGVQIFIQTADEMRPVIDVRANDET
jgi:hypothetical protein